MTALAAPQPAFRAPDLAGFRATVVAFAALVASLFATTRQNRLAASVRGFHNAKDDVLRNVEAIQAEFAAPAPMVRFGFDKLPRSARAELEAILRTADQMSVRLRAAIASLEQFDNATRAVTDTYRGSVPASVFAKSNLQAHVQELHKATADALSVCRETIHEVAQLRASVEEEIASQVAAVRAVVPLVARPWVDYFEHLDPESRGLTRKQVDAARATWWRLLEEHRSAVPLPTVRLTSEGTLRLAWSRTSQFLDVELHRSGAVEWFYTNDRSGDSEGSEELEEQVPAAFFERAGMFATDPVAA